MTRQKITICVKNQEYGKLLVRGLCNECTGLCFYIEEKIENALIRLEDSILITDFNVPQNPKILYLSDFNSKIDKEPGISKLTPISEIFLKIAQMSHACFNTKLRRKTYDKTKIISVFSEHGGSGVTSISIVLGRLLALLGNDVLYLNCGPIDDYNKYINVDFNGVSSKREYYFFSENGLNKSIESYIANDLWGLFYFKPERGMNSLFREVDIRQFIDCVVEDTRFSHIVVDYGKKDAVPLEKGETSLKIIHGEKQLVLSEECVENQLRLINFSGYKRNKKDVFHLRVDKTSFFKTDEKIDISMGSKFADDIESVLKSSNYLF